MKTSGDCACGVGLALVLSLALHSLPATLSILAGLALRAPPKPPSRSRSCRRARRPPAGGGRATSPDPGRSRTGSRAAPPKKAVPKPDKREPVRSCRPPV